MKKIIILLAFICSTISIQAQEELEIPYSLLQLKQRAENGDSRAKFYLGYCYTEGLLGLPQDVDKGVEFVKQACNEENPEAMHFVSKIIMENEDSPKAISTAEDLCKKAAEKGYVKAQKTLADWYNCSNCKLPENQQAAFYWYLKAASAGDDDAMWHVGAHYDNEKNFQQAYKWYLKSAQKGNTVSMMNLGDMYRRGNGVIKDINTSIKWYKKVAETGENITCLDLTEIYLKGEDGIDRDLVEAEKWYNRFCNSSNADAAIEIHNEILNEFAECYYEGKGTSVDYAKAFDYYKRAALNDNGYAQYSIGWMYEHGLGVTNNTNTALSWYRKAVRSGNKDARTRINELKPSAHSNTSTKSRGGRRK